MSSATILQGKLEQECCAGIAKDAGAVDGRCNDYRASLFQGGTAYLTVKNVPLRLIKVCPTLQAQVLPVPKRR